MSLKPVQPMASIGEAPPPRLEPAPLSTFARPPQDKYATIRTGGKYDKSHKYAQQMEEENSSQQQQQQNQHQQPQQQQQQQQQHHQQQQQQQQQPIGGTLDRRTAGGRRNTTAISQRNITEKTANGTSIVHQPLPDPPTMTQQPLSAAHFTQYRSPAPPTLPCCNQAQSQHRSQARSTGRTPEKFFSTSSQSTNRQGSAGGGGSRQTHAHTLDRRHGYASGQSGHHQQSGQQQQQTIRTGSQTLDRRGRQSANQRSTALAPLDHHQQHHPQSVDAANKDMYAVTEL